MAFTILSHFQIHSTRTFLAKCGNFHAPFQRVQPSMYVTYTVDLHHANLLAILSQYSAVPSVRPRTWNIYMTVYFIFPLSPSWITPSQSPFSMLSLGFEVGAECNKWNPSLLSLLSDSQHYISWNSVLCQALSLTACSLNNWKGWKLTSLNLNLSCAARNFHTRCMCTKTKSSVSLFSHLW